MARVKLHQGRHSPVAAVAALMFAIALCTSSLSAAVRFVDASATGANTGASWTDAYANLQSALAAAAVGDEIWMAAGTYRPAAPNGPRTATFQLTNGVALYGGFPTGGGTFDQRDADVHVTTLSGDLNGDDGPNFANNAENVYHVVSSTDLSLLTILDGVRVVAGNADGPGTDSFAAGGRFIDNDENGEFQITNCVFLENRGTNGVGGALIQRGDVRVTDCRFEGNVVTNVDDSGGVYVQTAGAFFHGCQFIGNTCGRRGGGLAIVNAVDHSEVVDCLFEGNSAGFTGGGLYYDFPALSNLTLTLRGCAFVQNEALSAGSDGGGGGLTAKNSRFVLSACRFIENEAGFNGGGAVLQHNTESIVANCDFRGNASTTARGGGLYMRTSGARVMGSLFVGNHAAQSGGGLILAECCPGDASIVNCTVAHNTAGENGGGLDIQSNNVVLANSIVWGNTDVSGSGQAAQIRLPNNPLLVSYTIVQGWTGSLGGTANNGSDPQFVDANGADNVFGNEDDDLRLVSGSPGIDSGNNAALPADSADVDNDANTAEALPLDVAGLPRQQDDPATADTGSGTAPLVDRGAHEFGEPSNVITYTGPSGGNWFTASNWSGGSVPDRTSSVLIAGHVQIARSGALAGDITIASGGQITLSSTGALLALSISIEGGGTLAVNDAAAVLETASLNVVSGGAVQWSAGTIIIAGGGWTQGAAINIGCAGTATLEVRDGALISAPSVQICPLGALGGQGTIAGNLSNDGLLAPGDPTGSLNVNGTYLQTASATLALELGGYATGQDYDTLAVTQQANLAGTLDVTLRPGFNHVVGGTHTLVTGNNVSGSFANIDLPSLPDTASLTYQQPGATSRTLYTMVSATGPRLHVNANGPPGGNAQGWSTSVRSLQSALDIVVAFPGAVEEIWVAAGTYVPDKSPNPPVFNPTFDLPLGVGVYGGFAGGETSLSERDWNANLAILSGDRLGDDGANFTNRDDNVFTVVRVFGSHINSTTLDGFVIRGGNGSGSLDTNSGGALDVIVGQPAIRNCTFEQNQAIRDGGAALIGGGGIYENCTFRNNRTLTGSGGGMYVQTSGGPPVRIVDCLFEGNTAASASVDSGDGGGLCIATAEQSAVIGCTFVNNVSRSHAGGGGGAIAINTHLVNCGFFGNHARRRGGGVYLIANDQTPVVNCIFSGNSADDPFVSSQGGAIYIEGSQTQGFVNCAVVGNTAEALGGIMRGGPGDASQVSNTIIWANEDDDGDLETSQVSGGGVVELSHCIVMNWTGALGGSNNSGEDPLLHDPLGEDQTPGTIDDDLSIDDRSPCIDAGANAAVPSDLADSDGDGFTNELVPLGLDGHERFHDDLDTPDTGTGTRPVVDIGAYEFGAPIIDPKLYIGPPGGSWFLASNWSNGQVPHAGTDVILNTHVVIARAAAEARDVIVQSGGVLEIADGTLTMRDATIQSGGTLRLSDPGAVLILRNFLTPSGSSLDWQSGTIHLLGTWISATTVNVGCVNLATLQLGDGGELSAPALVLCSLGVLEGVGTVACNLTSSGEVRPGLSPGLLTIEGDYTQTSDGTLVVEVDGFAPSEHDRIAITGDAALAGTLQAIPDPRLVPVIAQVLFLTAESVSGQFTDFVAPPLADGFTFVRQVLANRARLLLVPATSRLYVNASAPAGPGVTWESATPDLALGLATAAQSNGAISEIWVAAGVYLPTERELPSDAKTASFRLVNGLTLYGGFAGGETDVGQQDPETNVTVLSGDVLGNDAPDFANRSDNLYRVVVANDVSNTAVVDGFTVRGGHNGNNAPSGVYFFGGGVHCSNGSPTIRDCILLENYALRGGGGIYVQGGAITIDNCQFVHNLATVSNVSGDVGVGGGLLVTSGGSAMLSDCLFEDNSARASGAIRVEESSTLIASTCIFDSNKAVGSGAGIGGSNSALSLADCSFSNAGMLVAPNLQGGGVALFQCSASITDCIFSDNVVWSGGAAHLTETGNNVVFTNCEFIDNAAIEQRGGAILNDQGSPTFINCTFTNNTSPMAGGAVASYHFSGSQNRPVFTNCAFSANSATGADAKGGALYVVNGDNNLGIEFGPRLTGCTFDDNTSSGTGGAIYNALASLTLTDCTFEGNTAADGSSIFNENRGVIRGNSTLTGEDQLVSAAGVAPGQLSPGPATGVMTTGSSFQMINRGPSSGDEPSLAVDIGGITAGIDFDQIDVSNGQADITGTLRVKTVGGFQPGLGDVFDVLTARSLTGAFGVAFFPTMPPGLLMTAEYSSTGIALIVEQIQSLISFANPSFLDLPSTPSDIASGDLDNDGDLDIVLCMPSTPHGSPGSAYVLRNGGLNGQGQWIGFTISTPMTTGINPSGIAIGRLDSDAWLDIAIVNRASNSITTFRNSGTGAATFNSPQTIGLPAGPTAVAAAPLADVWDALFISLTSDQFAYVSFAANGSPSSPVTVATGLVPWRIAAADLDHDGDHEVVVLSAGSGGTPSRVNVHEATAPGPFAPAVAYDIGSNAYGLVVGDLNGDGWDDVAATAEASGGVGNAVILINEADGTPLLQPPAAVPIGQLPKPMAVLDVEPDGDLDLLALIEEAGPIIRLARNDQNAGPTIAFSEFSDLVSGESTVLLLTGDVNLDGVDDVISVNAAPEGLAGGGPQLAVRLNAEPTTCPADIAPVGGDGSVDVNDLLSMIGSWGPCPGDCAADIAPTGGDGVVDVNDLLILIGGWGACP